MTIMRRSSSKRKSQRAAAAAAAAAGTICELDDLALERHVGIVEDDVPIDESPSALPSAEVCENASLRQQLDSIFLLLLFFFFGVAQRPFPHRVKRTDEKLSSSVCSFVCRVQTLRLYRRAKMGHESHQRACDTFFLLQVVMRCSSSSSSERERE